MPVELGAVRRFMPWIAGLTVIVAICGGLFAWSMHRQSESVDRIAQLPRGHELETAEEKALLRARIAAVKEDPGNPLPWNALGDLLFAIEAFRQAEQVYRRSLDIDGTQAAIWALMGEANVRQGSERDRFSVSATHAFNRALTLDGTNLRAQYYLSMADYNNGRRSAGVSRMRYVRDASAPGSMAHDAARATLKQWASDTEID